MCWDQSRVRHMIPLHLTRLLYSTLVEPHITYCNLVWCLPVKTVMLDKILKIQKKYCRLMTFSSFTARSKPLFLQFKILPVYDIYKLQLATYMYKILNNLIPTFEHHSFITGSSIYDHDTRYKNYLRNPICRTTLRMNMICFQGPLLWNCLPENIKNAPSSGLFKKLIKFHLLSI